MPPTPVRRSSAWLRSTRPSRRRADADCLVFRDRRYSWADVTERTRRLANYLIEQGLGVHTERCPPGRARERRGSPGDLPAQRQRVPRDDARGAEGSRGVTQRQLSLRGRGACATCQRQPGPRRVVHSVFTPTLAEVLPELDNLRIILQVPDESGLPLLPGGRSGTRTRLQGPRRTARRSTGAPTTSTCSTPAARPACPRA